MNWSKVIAAAAVAALLGIILGFLLPFLISAKSTGAVVIGIAIIAVAAVVAVKLIADIIVYPR